MEKTKGENNSTQNECVGTMNALKLVTFDVTGTLLKLHPAPAVVYSQNAKDFGINVSAEDISVHFKPEWRRMSSEHPNFGCQTGLGWQTWWKMFVKNTFVKAVPNLSVEDKALNDLVDFLIAQYKTAKWWELADGATDILTNLNAAKVDVGVISNYDPRLEPLLEAVGIRQYLKFIVTSYGVGAMKPDRRIFEAAQARISNTTVSSSNCMHVGNDLELDFKGAVNCGWSAAIIDPKFIPSSSQETLKVHVFATLHELKDKFKSSDYQAF